MSILKPVLGSQLQLGHPSANGLVGCWLLNEGSGSKILDLSGHANNGTLYADTHFVAGKFGHALGLDGTGDYIGLGTSKTLDLLVDSTILMWVRVTGTRIGLYNKLTDGGAYAGATFEFQGASAEPGRLFYYSGGVGSWKSGNRDDLNDGEWHQVAIVIDHDTGGYFYADGLPDGNWSGSSEGALYDAAEAEFGRNYEDSANLVGGIDHAIIWNRALSAQEIAFLYLNPFQMFERRPIELITAAASAGIVDVTVEPDTLALALTQHAPTVSVGNDFSGDSNCKAVWNLESGALTADSKGGNTLTNDGVDEDTGDYKQGSCSGGFVKANIDRLSITNANLDSGFPLKSGESNKTFSHTFWFKCTGAISDSVYFTNMPITDEKSFVITLTSSKIRLDISSNGIGWDQNVSHATALVADRWYHVAVTYDGNVDDAVRIRIWDDTAQEIVGTDFTGIMGDIYIGAGLFYIGYPSTSLSLEGNMDEVVVFNDKLSVSEIDTIRAGTYPSGIEVTVYPDTLELALTQETATASIDVTVEPATFQLALTQQTPSLWSGTICYPSTLALALALQTPVVKVDFIAVPDPFSLALAQQTPVILTGDFCTVLVDSALELALAVEAPIILKNTLSWSAGLLTYKGVTYEISAGVTQKKFVYWDPNYTTVFRATDVLQDIFDADGWVMCLNESGMAYPAFARKLIHGGIIQAGTITAAYGQIAALTVGSDELKDLAVVSGKIANSAVEEAKIAASAISEGKLAALSVSSAKIQALAVTAAKIQDLTVTDAKIANLTVGTTKIAADATKKKRVSSTDGSISIGLDEVEVERINDFDSDGNEIEIHFHCEVTHTDSIGYPRLVNLYRDTTKIRESNVFISYGGGVVDIMWYYIPDSLGHDYVVKIDGYHFSDAAQYRRIAITQDKGK